MDIKTKECKRCNTLKNIDRFGLVAANRDGRNTMCKVCAQAYNKAKQIIRRARIKQREDELELLGWQTIDKSGLNVIESIVSKKMSRRAVRAWMIQEGERYEKELNGR